ncbi:type IX secretion system outer membrane channel protein PorV [Chryseosolibacter indicus]|uniref:Type IX secretion system outer membrane channel protein PorV n=1 Tax=Chryseosolibacter indicus TaxID=2782351 RepID=A0ABS5VKN2_9BACT|nr:type IX secretion system outer membrane channel protein PorV [Chryseosolibacter indicus]MBT1702003.1 type IX secretion system outer membrane channel protein PorV [Chryseosolibacter indicus]
MNLRSIFLPLLTLICTGQVFSQSTPPTNPPNPTPATLIGADRAITTAVPFLAITPDARHAALGDAGVASSPDANAAYWNAGKLVHIDRKYGGSLSYTPWLGKIINDMWISSLTGFYKLNKEEAIAVGFKYFDLGEINFRDVANVSLGDFNPKEAAFDVTYSRLLSQNLSVGITGRFIHSNLTGAFTGSDAQAGNTAAADIGVFYTKPFTNSTKNSTLSLGAQISNIGPKLSYTDNSNKDFLPTNLRIGGAYTTQLDIYNTLTFLLDFNKLMVPTVDRDQTLLSGLFGSFTDAPDGVKEEVREVMTSLGIEYWYNQTFAARLGYFLEAKDKGNRKYLTAGVGFRRDNFGIDAAYIVPTNKREHPLAETLRFTIMLLIPQNDIEREESITD